MSNTTSRSQALADRKLRLNEAIRTAEGPGHPFHGNQYTDGSAGRAPLSENGRGGYREIAIRGSNENKPVKMHTGSGTSHGEAALNSAVPIERHFSDDASALSHFHQVADVLESHGYQRVNDVVNHPSTTTPEVVNFEPGTKLGGWRLADYVKGEKVVTVHLNGSQTKASGRMHQAPTVRTTNALQKRRATGRYAEGPGHPFHGNQYTAGQMSDQAHEASKKANDFTSHATAGLAHDKAAEAHRNAKNFSYERKHVTARDQHLSQAKALAKSKALEEAKTEDFGPKDAQAVADRVAHQVDVELTAGAPVNDDDLDQLIIGAIEIQQLEVNHRGKTR